MMASIHAGAIAEHERALGGWQAELATHGLGQPAAWMPHAVDEILAALAAYT